MNWMAMLASGSRSPLYLLQTLFTIWVIVDVYRRRSETFWYWIVIGFPGIGAWVYFFVVMAPGMRLSVRSLVPKRKRPLEELEFLAQQTPTFENYLALGLRLVELGRYSEARVPLMLAQNLEAEHADVLYGLSRCEAEEGDLRTAIGLLEQMIRRNTSWSDYRAWEALIALKSRNGDDPGALSTARELARLSPTIKSEVILAEQLTKQGLRDEVARRLEAALKSYRFDPDHVRRLYRGPARQAKLLLKEAKRASPSPAPNDLRAA